MHGDPLCRPAAGFVMSTIVCLADCRYFFGGLARHGYRVANNEINLRCNAGTLTARCLDYIEYTLVKTDEQGRLITGPA